MLTIKKIIRFFDKTEDKTRGRLSRYPLIYAFISGTAVVMFWRAIWESIDMLWRSDIAFLNWFFYPPVQIFISIGLLLITGLLVSNFIGEKVIISGIRQEKKIEEKNEDLIKEEEVTLKQIKAELDEIKQQIVNRG